MISRWALQILLEGEFKHFFHYILIIGGSKFILDNINIVFEFRLFLLYL